MAGVKAIESGDRFSSIFVVNVELNRTSGEAPPGD
jgi:hypothetical protein